MQPAQPSLIEMFAPMTLIIAIFYFLIIRPQSKKMKLHDSFIKDLKRGDEVVTSSGIFGKIDGLTESVATLEIANGVKIKILRKQVAGSAAVAAASATPTETKK